MRRRLSTMPALMIASLAAVMVLGASAAIAKLSLANKRQAQQWDAELADTLDHMNETCGATVKAAIDWESFDTPEGLEALSGRWSVSSYCAPPINVLRWQCEKDAFGKAAARRIKKVTCRFAPAGKRSIALDGGEVVYGADLGAANADDHVKRYFLDVLKLAEQRRMQYEDEELAKEVAWTDKKCGTKLAWSIDWESFKKVDFLASNYSVHGYCDGVLSGLERVCGDADGKAAVKSTVKKVVCQHAGKPKAQSLSLSKGTLTWSFGWEGANAADVTHAWLLNNL
jgi:hypothetical protein